MNDAVARAYLAALAMIEQSGEPDDLHAAANFAGRRDGVEANDQVLCAYLSNAGPDDALRMALHLNIAKWDSAGDVTWSEGTEPNTDQRRLQIIHHLKVDDATAEVFAHHFPIAKGGDIVVADKWEQWYTDEIRKDRDFYWKSYKKLLTDKGWDATAIASLEIATDEVIERLSDPTREKPYQSKGLVVGYVQSGKTANFTGVVGKAIDAGYRLVIVLTGTTDVLRAQTQRRLDMELIGVENIRGGVAPDDQELLHKVDYHDDPDWLAGRFLSHGVEPAEVGRPAIDRLTTYKGDYRSLQQGIAALDFIKRERTLPFFHPENLFASDARVAVVKKNATVLKKLVADLRRIKARLGDIPTLIIDDESDQASVNTSNPGKWQDDQKDRTAINRLISELLRMLPRAQYVGYTATPFANVFIDPSDAEDIFPKDFLISLRRPPGYMGAADFHDLDNEFEDGQRTFANSAQMAHVRFVDDERGEDDRQLLEAMDAYVLTGAMKLYRSAQGVPAFRHHTMLVHEAMQRAVQRERAEHILGLWKKAGYYSPTSRPRLLQLFEQDILPVTRALGTDTPTPHSFDELLPYVADAVARIGQSANPVLVVNSDKDIEQEELDFDRRPVWRILVGGNKLARGFTIEGLTVSYFGRISKQADTMMQMGRWFGFRRNYRDLVRLYIRPKLYEGFEAIVQDEEYFRNELRRYAELIDGEPQITPKQIPPLVPQHLQWLKPAATNKMYNAVLTMRRSPGIGREPTAYPQAADLLAANARSFLPILKAASREVEFLSSPRSIYEAHVGIVPHKMICEVLDSLTWAEKDHFSPDLRWLRTLTSDKVNDWAVLFPQHVRKDEPRGLLLDHGPLSLFRRERRRPPFFGAISDPKHRRAADRIAGARDSIGDKNADELAHPRRGAILVYPVVEDEPAACIDQGEIILEKVVMAFYLVAPKGAPAEKFESEPLVTFMTRDSTRSADAIVGKASA